MITKQDWEIFGVAFLHLHHRSYYGVTNGNRTNSKCKWWHSYWLSSEAGSISWHWSHCRWCIHSVYCVTQFVTPDVDKNLTRDELSVNIRVSLSFHTQVVESLKVEKVDAPVQYFRYCDSSECILNLIETTWTQISYQLHYPWLE